MRLVQVDSSLATREYVRRMINPAEGAEQPKTALDLAARATSRFLASLQHGIDNGDRAAVASYARSFGLGAARDTIAPNKLEPLRTALR